MQTDDEEIKDCLLLLQKGESLEKLPPKFQNCKEVVLEAVLLNPTNIHFASDELQNDREFILLAVSKGMRLDNIPPQFRNDKEITLASIKKRAFNFQQASTALKNDPDVIIAALNGGVATGFISSKLLFTNDEVILAALKKNPFLYRSLSPEKQSNKVIFLEALKAGLSLTLVSEDFRNQKDVMLIAVEINGFNIEHVSEELKNDREVVFTALKQNISAILLILDQKIFKEELILYKMAKSEIPNFIESVPREILYEIGLKMKNNVLYESEYLEILLYQIHQDLLDLIHKECCFEVATLYMNGTHKNFKKSKKYFQESISHDFKKKECQENLEKLAKLVKGLNNKEIQTLEKCSNGDNYEIIKRLAKSSDATIFKVKRKSDNQELVLKRFDIEDMQFNNSLKEVILLMKLQHPHVCEIVDFFIDSSHTADEEEDEIYRFSIIMPLYEFDLHQYINKTKRNIPDNVSHFIIQLSKEINRIVLEICYGLDYVHSQCIIHRDLKPQNIFLTSDLKVKIADFGLSCQSSMKTLKKTLCGTKLYAAPEVLEDAGYDYTCDLFSLGGIIYDLISNVKLKTPLSIISLKNELNLLAENFKETTSPELKSITLSLLEENPKNRIKIQQIVEKLKGDPNMFKHEKIQKFSFSSQPSKPMENESLSESIELNEDIDEEEFPIEENEQIQTLKSILKTKKENNELKDKESIMEAYKYGIIEQKHILQYKLQNDRDVNLLMIKHGFPFEHIYEPLQRDKEIIKEAIKLDGSKFKYVSEDLKLEKEFLKEIVQLSPFSLQYSPLNVDLQFTLDSIETNEICFFFVSSQLQNDFDYCLDCIKRNYKSFQYFPYKYHSDKKFIKKAMIENINSLQYISSELKNSESFALELVEENGMALEFLSENLRNNKKIVKLAFENNPDCYIHISKEIQYSINSSVYKTITKIAEGGEGMIFKVEKSGIQYAEKRIIISDLNHLNETIKQFSNLLLLKHENIFKIVDILQDENDVIGTLMVRIIMELYEGDLSSYISSNKNGNLPEDLLVDIAIQITQGILYLHQNNIIHADLKPENIFLNHKETGGLVMKIGDFGLNDFKNFDFYGSLMYVAPEIVDNSSSHTFSSDCFSLGAIMLRMMRFEDELIYLKSLKGEIDLSELNYSEKLKNIVLKLLDKNKFERLSAEETLKELTTLKK